MASRRLSRPVRSTAGFAGLILGIALAGASSGTVEAAVTATLPDPDWHIPPPAEFRTTPVTHPDFLRLQEALTHYAALADDGGWPVVAAGPVLTPGMRDPRVAELRARLRRSGDYDAEMGADPWLFDAALRDAVLRFQDRHGLPASGSLDDRTREAADVTAAERRDQIEVALERWRWLPRNFESRYAWANVPAATLVVIDGGGPVLAMPTVVGHPARPTPSLRSEIRQVVFQPTWSVPRSIAVEDLLPMQQQDADFLARQRIRVFRGEREVDAGDVRWQQLGADRFPYRLVQDAGPGNSLGRVKFVMDNPYDIYLHDTPARGFFGLTGRMLSAGCVRLGEPLAFADLVLGYDRDWSPEDTAARLASPATQNLNLRERLPVYIVYMTAWVTADGAVHFRRDVYGRDAAVLAALRDHR